MENTNSNKSGVIVWITGIAFAATAALGAYQYTELEKRDISLAEVSGTADSLMVVKSSLNSEIATLSENLNKEIEAGKKTEEELNKVNGMLARKNSELKALRNTRAKNLKDQKAKDEEIALLNTQINDLNTIKGHMEEELTKIPILESEKLKLEESLAKWEMDYAALQNDFQELDKKHAKLLFDAPGDNFHVEAITQGSKLTSKAKKVKKIKVSFLLPEYMQRELSGQKNLYLSLFDEKIQPLPGWSKEVSVASPGSAPIPVQVHAMKTVDYSKNPQAVEFIVEMDEKLEPGLYKGKIYADDDYLGTVDFRLRDSFLFF